MKILLVNDFTERIAGAEIYMWNLKYALEKKGHNVSIFGSTYSKNDYITSRKKKLFLQYLKRIFNPKAYLDFLKVVNDYKPDIIHLQNILNELSPSILLATRSIPVIMTVHDNSLVNAVSILSESTGKECEKRTCRGCTNCVGLKGAVYEFIKRNIHSFMLNRISLYVTPSHYMGEFIEEAGFTPVKVIPNGINPLPATDIRNFENLLYIGRLTRDKGIEFLLKAMPQIVRRYPHAVLYLVGDGTDKDFFINMTRDLQIQDNVKFIGSVSGEEIESYYINASIVVVPSIFNDNFPTVCIEAMSVGRPIIGTRMGGIPELIDDGQTGYLIPPYSAKAIAEKTIKLLADKKLLREMSHKAVSKSHAYSLEKHAGEIEKIYKKVITDNKNRK